MKIKESYSGEMQDVIDWIIFGLALFVSITFLLLPPKVLRKIYPGWAWLEAKMWRSEFFNNLLKGIIGQERYKKHEQEWLKSQGKK